MARMAREAAADSEQRRATTALALLDALASPPWEEVCRADGDSDAQAETLPADSLPAVRAALLTHEGLRLPWGERDLEVWSRALGSVARNSLWVRIPNPLVFYLSEFEGALPGGCPPLRRLQYGGAPQGESSVRGCAAGAVRHNRAHQGEDAGRAEKRGNEAGWGFGGCGGRGGGGAGERG